MIIQHNIMAMNAYRNYKANTSALSSNLEKLSSGYKINRAGDDAAGLAISEKMRAQITGLEAAQKNVKDGISLVKTAEGAMQEVQDMLNRMDYLATQSANGTYDDEVDRLNLQKEVDALKTEINRIADSANFNGIKLLDGSQSSKGNAAGLAEAKAALAAANAASNAAPTTSNGLSRMPTADISIASGDKAYEVAGSKNIYDTTSAAAAKGSFTIDLNTLNFTLDKSALDKAAATAVGAAGFTVTIGSGTDKLTLSIGTKSIATNTKYTVTANGTSAATAGFITATNVAKDLVNSAKGANGAASATVTLNGVDWTMTANAGVLTFVQKNDPTSASTARVDFNVSTGFTADTNAKDGTVTLSGAVQAGTQPSTVGAYKIDGNRANTTFDLTAADIKDGTVITVGTTSVTLKVGANGTAAQGTTDALVDLTAYEAGSLSEAEMHDILAKIVKNIGTTVTHKLGTKATATFEVGVGSNGHSIRVQRSDNGANIYTKKEELAEVFQISVPATKPSAEELASLTKAAAASNFAGKPLTLQIGDTSDKFNQMEVEIGELHTSAMGIIGSDGNVETGKSIADIDIGSQSGAQAAIDVIKGAINYVSGIRGDLGAIQNRLEHTGNNLSVMAENIQDAESTIRDTDVAEEMMSYVKNNILVQSAQAMLAQANQVPQGVLQLLG